MQTAYEYVTPAGVASRITPEADWVLIRRHPKPEYEGLIALPANLERRVERLERGEVLATGPGKRIDKGTAAGRREPMPVAPGDTVLISHLLGVELTIEGEKLYMVEVDGIAGIVTEQAG